MSEQLTVRGEIDRDFYCSAGFKLNDGGCRIFSRLDCDKDHCRQRRRKWPTPEQFKEEYGFEYPDDGLVWYVDLFGYTGVPGSQDHSWVSGYYSESRWAESIVCVCTPWGRPPDNWRPEDK